MDIIKKIAAEFKVKTEQVENTVGLIDEGNTIPFIARYRKEVTGGLSDVILRDMDERLKYLRGLRREKRRSNKAYRRTGKAYARFAGTDRKSRSPSASGRSV